MKQIKKSTLFLALIAIFLPVLSMRSKKSTEFSLKAISAELSYNSEWEGRALNAEEETEVSGALSQSYRYLGSGGQCFAFVSEDGRYVVKFLKQAKFKASLFASKKGKKRRDAVYSAFKLAFDHLPQETGLLLVHLNATSHLGKVLIVSDEKNAVHELDLDPLPFIVQKKADLAFPTIDAMVQKGDISGAERAIDQLLALPKLLAQKGFRNRDSNVRSNCGFVGTQAIVFDVGRIALAKKADHYKKEFQRMTPRLRHYLTQQHPELLPYFEESVAKAE